jgi:hypothetical protein
MTKMTESIKKFLMDCGVCCIINYDKSQSIIKPIVIRKYCHTVIIMESQYNYQKK